MQGPERSFFSPSCCHMTIIRHNTLIGPYGAISPGLLKEEMHL